MTHLDWSPGDEAALTLAVGLLEKETLTDTLLSIAGAAAGAGLKGLNTLAPAKIGENLGEVLARVLEYTFDKVLLTVDRDGAGLTASSWFSRLSVALSGGGRPGCRALWSSCR